MIAIIGGGISGLTLAHELARRDRPFVLLEAASRVGGVIRSGRVDDRVLEFGPQRARLTKAFAALTDDLGLTSELITAPPSLPLLVYRQGTLRTVPVSARAFIACDLLSLRGRLRMMLEPFTPAARDDETVAGYFTRKLGREAYENLAGPLYGGLYASDPQDMVVGLSLGPVLREFAVRRSIVLALLKRGGSVAPPDACSFRDGLDVLTRALHQRHADSIRLNASVHAIERSATSLTVVTDTDRIEARDVVITVPARAAALMLKGIASGAAASIGSLQYNPLAVVHLHADTDLYGMGCQVALDEPLVTRGVTWNDALFGRDGVYTAYLGGARNPWIADESDDSVGSRAVAEFRTMTGFDARVLSVTRAAMPAWDRTWSAIQSLDLPAGIHLHANWCARPGLPGRLMESVRLARRLAEGTLD